MKLVLPIKKMVTCVLAFLYAFLARKLGGGTEKPQMPEGLTTGGGPTSTCGADEPDAKGKVGGRGTQTYAGDHRWEVVCELRVED